MAPQATRRASIFARIPPTGARVEVAILQLIAVNVPFN
jgi:hypothetical protein